MTGVLARIRDLDAPHMGKEREGSVKTQGEDGHLHAKERGLEQILAQLCQHLSLRLPVSP